MKVMIVGAGAIGCELLKNFALLGVGASPNPNAQATRCEVPDSGHCSQVVEDAHDGDGDGDGAGDRDDGEQQSSSSLWRGHCPHLRHGGILITDMDSIERSNLNRQLLFRQHHLGQAKATVAAIQARQINPDLHIHGMTHKVSPDTEDIFDPLFWQDLDVVVTALDNVDARKYVDGQCMKYKRVLLDSGTLGTKANSQVSPSQPARGVPPWRELAWQGAHRTSTHFILLCTIGSAPVSHRNIRIFC
jgi:hypothetical protein